MSPLQASISGIAFRSEWPMDVLTLDDLMKTSFLVHAESKSAEIFLPVPLDTGGQSRDLPTR